MSLMGRRLNKRHVWLAVGVTLLAVIIVGVLVGTLNRHLSAEEMKLVRTWKWDNGSPHTSTRVLMSDGRFTRSWDGKVVVVGRWWLQGAQLIEQPTGREKSWTRVQVSGDEMTAESHYIRAK